MKTTKNYGLKKPESSDFYNVDDFNENADAVDAKLKEMDNHIANKSNPHSITKSQVGLGNVPNVTTNDQTPTYTPVSSLTALSSGEKLSVAFGKVAKAVSTLISHISTTASTTVLGHVKFGTTSGTACQGNDSRLSDSRTPKSHASTGTEYGVATTSNYGHVKLSNSSAVTEYAGLALPATEKNAGIGGTLANQIAGKMDKSEALIITKSLSYGYTAPSKERLQLGVTSAASICPSGYTLIAKTVETVGSSNVQASFGTNEILTLYNYASTSISGTVYVRYTYAKTVNITT